jgi:hypothetical protein
VANPAVTVDVKGKTDDLDAALTGAQGKINGFASALNDPTTKLGKMAQMGVKAAKSVVDLTVDGGAAIQSQEKFAKSMEQLGQATGDWETKTTDAINAMQNLGFSDDDARDAITDLTTATGDLDAALAHLPSVADIARNANTDLVSAADAVALAINGQDAPIRKMIDGLAEGTTALGTLDAAYVASMGQADLWAQSAEGTTERAKIALGEAAESLGVKLYEAFGKVKEALQPVWDALGPFMDAMSELHTALLPFLNPLIETLGKFLNSVGNALGKIVRFATRVLTFFTDLLTKLQDVRTKLDEIMPDFNILNGEGLIGRTDSRGFFQERDWMNKGGSAGTGGGQTRAAGGVGSTMAAPLNMTINIHGDPSVIEAKVASAIRNYNRRNGAGAIFSPGRS